MSWDFKWNCLYIRAILSKSISKAFSHSIECLFNYLTLIIRPKTDEILYQKSKSSHCTFQCSKLSYYNKFLTHYTAAFTVPAVVDAHTRNHRSSLPFSLTQMFCLSTRLLQRLPPIRTTDTKSIGIPLCRSPAANRSISVTFDCRRFACSIDLLHWNAQQHALVRFYIRVCMSAVGCWVSLGALQQWHCCTLHV